MNKTSRVNSGSVLIFLLCVGYVAILNYKLFEFYRSISLVVVVLYMLLSVMLSAKFAVYDFVLLLIAAIYSLVSVTLNGGGFGSIVTYLSAMLIITIISNTELSTKQKNRLAWASFFAELLFVISTLKYGNTENWNYLRYHGVNPNSLGMFLLYGYMIWYSTLGYKKTIIIRILLAGIACYGIFLLKARAILFVLLLFLLLNMLPHRIQTPKFFLLVSVMSVAIGLIFPFVYLYLYRTGVQLVLWNKTLYTGREVLWSQMLDYLSQSWKTWLFGLGSKGYEGNIDLNVHNDYFAAIFNFGIVGFIIFETFIFKYIKRAVANVLNQERLSWLCMFICVSLVLGITETTTHWAAIFVFSFVGLGMANTNGVHELPISIKKKRYTKWSRR